MTKFPRILLKLSGESLGKDGVDGKALNKVAREIAAVNKKGIAIAIVIGGGNIWRFRDKKDLTALPRIHSDYLGMLATVFNGVTLSATLNKLGVKSIAFSAVQAPDIVKKYSPSLAQKVLAKGGIAILTGGTGKPFVTTDTAAAMRAIETKCDRVLKATNVDGVYSADPRKSKSAKLFKELDYKTAIKKQFGVMDIKAFRLLAKHKIPLTIFNFSKKGLLAKAAEGDNVGTVINA